MGRTLIAGRRLQEKEHHVLRLHGRDQQRGLQDSAVSNALWLGSRTNRDTVPVGTVPFVGDLKETPAFLASLWFLRCLVLAAPQDPSPAAPGSASR